MEIHPLDDIDGQAKVTRDSRSALRWMTSEQLLDLGMNQVAYLKSGLCDGKMLFVLFGADGMPAVVADNLDAALETAIEQGLGFVAVHRRGPCQSLPQASSRIASHAYSWTAAMPHLQGRTWRFGKPGQKQGGNGKASAAFLSSSNRKGYRHR